MHHVYRRIGNTEGLKIKQNALLHPADINYNTGKNLNSLIIWGFNVCVRAHLYLYILCMSVYDPLSYLSLHAISPLCRTLSCVGLLSNVKKMTETDTTFCVCVPL